MDRGFAAVADDKTDIKSKMATKDDITDVNSTLAGHTKILNDHTRPLGAIKSDATTNLDKRLQLEVRVSAIEKGAGTRLSRQSNRSLLTPPIPAGKMFRRGRDPAGILRPQPPVPSGRD